MTLLRKHVEKSKKSYPQVQLFAKKNEAEKFQHIVYVKNKLEYRIYLLDVMNSVFDEVTTNKPICIVLY